MMNAHKFLLILFGWVWLTACSDSDSSNSSGASFDLTPKSRFAALGSDSHFGNKLASSKDGQVVVIGANASDQRCFSSGSEQMITSKNDIINDCQPHSNQVGGVYVYHLDGENTSSFLLKPFKQMVATKFGNDVSLSEDGTWLAVADPDDSMFNNLDSDKCKGVMTKAIAEADCDNLATSGTNGYKVGAVYLFKYDHSRATPWTLEYFVKPDNAQTEKFREYHFGETVALFGDGSILVVGVPTDKSNEKVLQLTEPDLSITGGKERGALFAYNLSTTPIKFQYYYQAPDTASTHLGKVLQPQSDKVLAAGDQRVFAVAENNGTGYLDLSSQLTLHGLINALSLRNNTLVLGLEAMKSDCTGVTPAAEKTCFNDNGSVANAGGVLVYRGTPDNNNRVEFTLESTLTVENPTANNAFGRAVAASEDGQYILVGANDDKGCEGAYATVAACTDKGESDAVGSGAVYEYKKSGDSWALNQLIKADKVEDNGNFGGVHQLEQMQNRFYFGFNRSDLCQGYTDDPEDLCDPITGLPNAHFELRTH